MTAADRELLPCPFCGGTDIDASYSLAGNGDINAGCMTCGASGPDAKTQEPGESAKAWNRRSSPPDGVTVPVSVLKKWREDLGAYWFSSDGEEEYNNDEIIAMSHQMEALLSASPEGRKS